MLLTSKSHAFLQPTRFFHTSLRCGFQLQSFLIQKGYHILTYLKALKPPSIVLGPLF